MSALRTALASVALTALLCGGADAAVEVLGDGPARLCFLAANAGRYTPDEIDTCTAALATTDLSPRDRAATLINRGVIQLGRRDYDAAIADFNRGIEARPQLGEGYLNRGATYIALNRFQEALADINKGMTLGISAPHIGYYDRAIANEALGNTRAAYDDYRQALTLAPDFERASNQLKRFKVVDKPSGS